MKSKIFALLSLCFCAVAIRAPTARAGPRWSFELLPTGGEEPHLFGEGMISTPGDGRGGRRVQPRQGTNSSLRA